MTPKIGVRYSEIFLSLQGEGPFAGLKTVFVRLQGCGLRCRFCDTKYAQDHKGGTETSLGILVDVTARRAEAVSCEHICITGGEPLYQPVATMIIELWRKRAYHITIETNGSFDIKPRLTELLPNTHLTIVMDIKTPCSGMESHMYFANLGFLRKMDVVKFVCEDVSDVKYAEKVLKAHPTKAQLYISPVWGTKNLKELADTVMYSRYPFRLQAQLQKIIWGSRRRGV